MIAVGTLGYMLLGFTFMEALYQTVTTVATVGFREVHPLTTLGQLFTIGLIILGAGTVLYNLGLLVEAVTEGQLRLHLERRRMDKDISQMRGHVIICGFGRVGSAAAERLLASGADVVVIDKDADRLRATRAPHLIGDVNGDALLREAGIQHAQALIAALDTDPETVYLTLSARALNPDLVIVARARTSDSKAKLLLAGATRAVNPQRNGGRRMAVFARRPHVAEFIDDVMHDDGLDSQIQQVDVCPASWFVDRTTGEIDVTGRTGALLLAIRHQGDATFEANPTADTVVTPHSVLIAFGTRSQTAALTALAALTQGPVRGT